MNLPPNGHTTPVVKYPVLLFLTLVAAGLAGNYFKYELFFNIQFIFGSVFAMLALQMLGLAPGILAAALISSITYLLWNHPYAIVIMTAEVITVGLLTRRKGLGLVLACALYWLCLGMPLAYHFHHGLMHLPVNNALIIMVKQALNGMVNVLVARLLFMALGIVSKKKTFSYREIVFHLLTLFVLVPSLFVLTQDSRTEFTDTNQAVKDSLIHSSSRTARTLDQWLQSHHTLVSHLARMATNNESSSLQSGIEEIHSGNPDFLRVGLLDQNATVVAFSPVLDESGQPNLGRNFADRPWIPALKQTLKPMLSEIVITRINTPEPAVSMLAPVVRDGVYNGYAIGVLNLKALKQIIEIETKDQGMDYTLLDKNGKVIISNHNDLKTMEAFTREPGDLQRLDNGVEQWTPYSAKNISFSERWKKSSYLTGINVGSMAEWKLILEQPVAPFQEKLYHRYSTKLGQLLLVLAIALALAELISKKIIDTLERLNVLSTALPRKLLAAEEIVWPQSAILETASLLNNFRGMANALSEKFHEINELNTTLEGRIQQRTREVLQIATRYQTLMLTATDGIHILDEQGNVIEVNDSFCQMLGYTCEELSKLNVHDWDALHSKEELLIQIPSLIQRPALFTTKHRRKDGEIRDVEISAGGVTIDGKSYLFNATRDITDRKRAEEALVRSIKEKEVMLKEIHHRVKNNLQVVYSLLNLQAKGIADQTVRAMFEESKNRVSSMALIHERLYRSEDLAFIDFKEYLQRLIVGIADTYNRRDIVINVDMEPLSLDINKGIPCGLIVNELASNSLKHAFPEGRNGKITLCINKNNAGQNILTIADNGIGFPAGIDFKNTSSLGMQLVTVLTGQLNGTIVLLREEGTKFIITFPDG